MSGDAQDRNEIVRERAAAAARGARSGASRCGDAVEDSCGGGLVGGALYGSDEAADAPPEAVAASLGCGVPTAVADLHAGRPCSISAEFTDVEIRETRRVHEHATAAIVRAVEPVDGCCSTVTLAACCEPSAKAECCGGSTATAPSRCGCSPQ